MLVPQKKFISLACTLMHHLLVLPVCGTAHHDQTKLEAQTMVETV